MIQPLAGELLYATGAIAKRRKKKEKRKKAATMTAIESSEVQRSSDYT